MLHFGHYNITDRLVRQFLALVHDGYLWIQDRIPIDVALIHRITDLPMEGPDPLLNTGKKYEGKITDYMRETYHVEKNTRGFMIKSISDPGM